MPSDPTAPSPVIPTRDISASAPAKPPRELTAHVRRAIWTEPRVRRWWLLAGAILILFAAFTFERVLAREQEIRLIRDGTLVTAQLTYAENRNENQLAETSDEVTLTLLWPGNPEPVRGHLTTPAVVRHELKVRVDPADHRNWTDRTDPPPLLDSLFVGLLVSPLVPALFVVAWLNMRRMRSVWETGSAQVAVIFDRRQSPIAPMSYTVRCSLQNHRDKKLFNVHVPKVGYGLGKGDLIWVIMPVKKGSPIAALWIGEEQEPA